MSGRAESWRWASYGLLGVSSTPDHADRTLASARQVAPLGWAIVRGRGRVAQRAARM